MLQVVLDDIAGVTGVGCGVISQKTSFTGVLPTSAEFSSLDLTSGGADDADGGAE